MLDDLVYYLFVKINSEKAAKHLLDNVGKMYKRLQENPYQFPYCSDLFLKGKEYRKAIIVDMEYLLIFRIEENYVYVLGIFHRLEDYREKI